MVYVPKTGVESFDTGWQKALSSPAILMIYRWKSDFAIWAFDILHLLPVKVGER